MYIHLDSTHSHIHAAPSATQPTKQEGSKKKSKIISVHAVVNIPKMPLKPTDRLVLRLARLALRIH